MSGNIVLFGVQFCISVDKVGRNAPEIFDIGPAISIFDEEYTLTVNLSKIQPILLLLPSLPASCLGYCVLSHGIGVCHSIIIV